MDKKIMTTRKAKAMETRNRIYESAKELFTTKDYKTVNVDDIVKHAGVAKGSFYVHFESKDYLIAMLISDYVKQVDLDYKAYLNSLPSNISAYDILLSLVAKIADVITERIGCNNMSMLYKILIENDFKTNALTDYNRELYHIFYDIIEAGIQQKTFHPSLDAKEITRHFIAAYRGLTIDWCIRYPNFDLKEQALRHFEILLTGICSTNSANR